MYIMYTMYIIHIMYIMYSMYIMYTMCNTQIPLYSRPIFTCHIKKCPTPWGPIVKLGEFSRTLTVTGWRMVAWH